MRSQYSKKMGRDQREMLCRNGGKGFCRKPHCCGYGEVNSNRFLLAVDDSLFVTLVGDFITSSNLLENDFLDGNPVDPESVSISLIDAPAGVSVSPEGNLLVQGNVIALGNHAFQYQVCIADTSICSIGQVNLSVYLGIIKSVSADNYDICKNGGNTVLLTGEGFYGVTSVTIGGIEVESFEVIDYFHMSIVTPGGLDSSGGLAITNFEGTYNTSIDFTLLDPPIIEPITGDTDQVCTESQILLFTESPGGTWYTSNEGVAQLGGFDGMGHGRYIIGAGPGTAIISYCVTDLGCTDCQEYEVEVFQAASSSSPLPVVAIAGDTVVFSVKNITGANPVFQWYVSTDGGDNFDPISNDEVYSGADTAELTVVTDENFADYMFYVEISVDGPCDVFVTDPTFLTLADIRITQNPESTEVCEGQAAVFTAEASGTTFTVQWYMNAGLGLEPLEDGTFEGLTFSGAGSEQLEIEGLTTLNTGFTFLAAYTTDEGTYFSAGAAVTVTEC